MYFDASNPYHRHMLHYESDHQLAIPELIARGSVDARTAATVWYLLERRASIIVAGPTDPTPGVGKTTTLNALLPFYPTGTGLVYTLGMYEDFAFTEETPPAETTVLANEVSDHLRIYMWGRVARRFLRLPQQGFAVATSCHADTLADVMAMLTDDVKLTTPDVERLQLIVNIGLNGRGRSAKRRWLTTHFIIPNSAVDGDPATVVPRAPQTALVARWEATTDTFPIPANGVEVAMAQWVGVSTDQFAAAVQRRATCLQDLANNGADMVATIQAIQAFREGPGETQE